MLVSGFIFGVVPKDWGQVLFCAFPHSLSATSSGRHGEVEKIAVERGQITDVGIPAEHGVAGQLTDCE